jgi:2-polyprenyl-3-methyl-5-hydroxy-6-metoxy-1,4-benzoquinol methylase
MGELPKETSTRAEHEIAHGQWLVAHDPEQTWGWGTPAGQLRAARRAGLIVEGARLAPGKRALEVGCGTGNFTERFATSGANIVAVDISSDLLELARRRGLASDRVVFLAKRFEECDIDGPFDAVIGSSILHHLDISAALPKMFDLLKPGGWFSFAEPNYLNPQVFLERKLRFLPIFNYTSPDETAFVRWPLGRQLSAAGFANVSIQPFDWLHPRVPPMLIKTVLAAAQIMERTPVIREFAGSLCIRAQRPR